MRKFISFFKRLIDKILGRNALYYICGNGALPLPLTPEEEKEALDALKNGDSTKKSLLIERNLRLVVYIAKKFENAKADQEDLVSVGTIGLIKAVNSYNLDKNIKLATYASRCIENEILMHLRKISKTKVELSLEEPLNVDGDGNELLISDILGSDPDMVYNNLENKEEVELLYNVYEKLTNKEQYIMKMRFGLFGTDMMTQKEVADSLGISQSYISRLEKKIIYKIRKEFRKMV
ncbi:MAG: RNA polymerase sporulation sigma factor SigK [Clostridia bacterium]|nr:RNA polymerase sporulation sigma factor SigK [Clostridia bacterium]MBR2398289.1 RNA polymerase sporulation sigma factor SigK [Clostridia bacterium]MBR2875029.1 RNA polymerase sporulation sigma factor SigK [Clostridia bacterium]